MGYRKYKARYFRHTKLRTWDHGGLLVHSQHWECGRAPTPAQCVGCPCSVLRVPSASVIAAPGIVAVPISPVMSASMHAQPELTVAHARVHPWARKWACTLLVPACWRAFQRPGRGDIDGERSALGLAHVVLISGRVHGWAQRTHCRVAARATSTRWVHGARRPCWG